MLERALIAACSFTLLSELTNTIRKVFDMAKTSQRTSAMASALVITFTSTLAFAYPGEGIINWGKRQVHTVGEGAETAKEGYDVWVEIGQYWDTRSLTDLYGRSPEHTLFIFGLTFALTWLILRKWDWPKEALYGIPLGSYVASVIFGFVYEAFRASNHVEAEQWAWYYMLLPVIIAMPIAFLSQYKLFWNMWTEFWCGERWAFLTFLIWRHKLSDVAIRRSTSGSGITPDTTPAPTPVTPAPVLDNGQTPPVVAPTTPEEGQPVVTPVVPTPSPITTPNLRPAEVTKDPDEAACLTCGFLTEVGSPSCGNCGEDPKQAAAETPAAEDVTCSGCGRKTEANNFCGYCPSELDQVTTREDGAAPSIRDERTLLLNS